MSLWTGIRHAIHRDRHEKQRRGQTLERQRIPPPEERRDDELLRQPLHPYTVGLLASAPRLGAGRRRFATIPWTAAAPLTHYEGCRFADRCQEAMEDVCWGIPQTLTEIESERQVRCYLHGPTKRDKI